MERYHNTVRMIKARILSAVSNKKEFEQVMHDEVVGWAILLTRFMPSPSPITTLGRFIDDTVPRMTYSRRDDVSIGKFHWGQYKLLLSEIEFLSYARRVFGFDILEQIDCVVYAGSANGLHIVLLADMFPEVHFHCWDPSKFAPPLHAYAEKHPDRVTLFNALYTEEVARTYADKKTLFISDVRQFVSKNGMFGKEADNRDDKLRASLKDQDHTLQPGSQAKSVLANLQRMWVQTMRPMATMLKFAPPYPTPGEPDDYSYFDGMVLTQAYAPFSTTEARLMFDGVPGERIYNTRKYEEQFVFVNSVLRQRDLGEAMHDRHEIVVRDGTSDTTHVVTIPITKMHTSTPIDSFDQWRSTQILFEWILTEVSRRKWLALPESKRAQYRPLGPHMHPDNINVFYKDLIEPENLDSMIATMNKIIDAFVAIVKQSFGNRMLMSVVHSDKE